jgi:hypothetical protein
MSTSPTAPTSQSAWGEKMPKPAEEMSTFLCLLPGLPDSKRSVSFLSPLEYRFRTRADIGLSVYRVSRMSVRPQHLKDAAIGHSNGWISALDIFTLTDSFSAPFSFLYLL